MLFEDVLDARLPETPGGALRPIAEKAGFIADLTAKTYAPMGNSPPPNRMSSGWLPTERLARSPGRPSSPASPFRPVSVERRPVAASRSDPAR